MKKKLNPQSAFFNRRVLVSFAFCLIGVALALLAFGFYPSQSARAQVLAEPESTRDYPPDTIQYTRDPVPEDYAPLGRRALASTIFIVDPTVTAGDTGSESEPSIAIDPVNPNQIVIHGGFGGWNGNASVFHSTDGGVTWTVRASIPPPPMGLGTAGCPCDTALDYGRGNRLSGTFLANEIYSGTSTDPTMASAFNYFAPGGVAQLTNFAAPGSPDQPWLLVNSDPVTAAQDNVYVGYDDFNGGPDMRVSVATGSNPPNFVRDNQSGTSTGGVNPGHRLAVGVGSGVVFSLWQRCIANCGGDPKTIEYRLNRSTDGGQTWPLNGGAGTIVSTGFSTQPTPKFGTVNALLGGVDHAAVDPNSGDIYYVYGSRDPVTSNNRIAIRRIVDAGVGGVIVGPEVFVTGQIQAALPSVAVASNGGVGVLYTSFDGFSGGFPAFSAHFAMSQDQGVTFTDTVLESFLSPATDNGNSRQRVLGDYQQLKAVGQIFYGTFSGNGAPFGGPANIDPIFFKVSPVVTHTLTVNSSNPNSGVNIAVSPNDNNGNGSGTTPFNRVYNNNTAVTLTAPATAGVNTFQKWQRDGVDVTTSPTTNVTMDADHTMTAVYMTPPTPTPTPTPCVPGSGREVDGIGSIAASGGQASFTFHVRRPLRFNSFAQGYFMYNDPGAGVGIANRKLTKVSINGNHAHFSGQIRMNRRVRGFTVDADDCPDFFSVRIDGFYSRSGPLTDGDIIIHN